jgi:eukaryotic-like serine/threonine-protein kinase
VGIGNLDNRYTILSNIYEGYNSNIYKAQDNENNNVVAIKIIKNTSIIDKDFIKKFKKEIDLLKNLDCENIVNIYDIVLENNTYYIVMEYIDGISLKDLLKGKNMLDINAALNIVKKIAYALDLAHKKSIIHRDLQPQNILISTDNKIKINNFGIVKSAISSSKNNIKDVVSNINYISPEEILGGYIDKSTDLYSLGIILYEMVFGKLPFNYCEDLKSLYENIINGIEWNKYDLNNDYKNITHIIKRLSNKKPIERYKDISELLNDIDNIKNYIDIYEVETKNKGVLSNNKSRLNKNKNNNKKHIKRYATAGAALLAIGLGTYIYINGYEKNEGQQTFIESSKNNVAPDFKNLTKDKILEITKSMDINVNIKEAYDENVKEGLAISQYPKAGTSIKTDETITVIISKGSSDDSNKVVVQNMTGVHLSEAMSIANNLGIKLNVEYGEDKTKPNGTVLSQSISSGTEVDKESTITVVVNDIKRTESSNDNSYTDNTNTNSPSKPITNKPSKPIDNKPSKPIDNDPNTDGTNDDSTNEDPIEQPDNTNNDNEQDVENSDQPSN